LLLLLLQVTQLAAEGKYDLVVIESTGKSTTGTFDVLTLY
jgi:hypothetical protein